ncbi:MAG: Zn-ribbon domain-containing OB-fold protein [Hyphomicrobiaceae bacterium]
MNGRGKLHSWTVVRRAFSPEFADKIPYVIGLVEFADAPGIRYLADIINAEPEQLVIDMAVDAVFDTSNPSLVHFQPVNL